MLLDFSKKRTFTFEFRNLDEKICKYSRIITAENVDMISEIQEKKLPDMLKGVNLNELFEGIDLDDKEAIKNIDKSQLMKHVDIEKALDLYGNDDSVRDEINKVVLGDDYNQFLEDTKGIFNAVSKALNKMIIKEIDELSQLISEDNETKGNV